MIQPTFAELPQVNHEVASYDDHAALPNIPPTTDVLADEKARYHRASWEYGFPEGTEGKTYSTAFARDRVSTSPVRADFNAAFYRQSEMLFFLQNGGFPEYDAALNYTVGARVLFNNQLWRCHANNGDKFGVIATPSPSKPTYWKPDLLAGMIDEAVFDSYVPDTNDELKSLITLRAQDSGAKFVGDIRLCKTYPTNGWWYLCNGQSFVVGTKQQRVISMFSQAFRTMHGMTTSTLPNLMDAGSGDTKGRFVRFCAAGQEGQKFDYTYPSNLFSPTDFLIGNPTVGFGRTHRSGPGKWGNGTRMNSGSYAPMSSLSASVQFNAGYSQYSSTELTPASLTVLPLIFLGV